MISHKFMVTLGALFLTGAGVSAMTQAPKQSKPAMCFTMDLTPYSSLEPLSIRSGDRTIRLKVEIADTFREREQGLMCRTGLKDDYGMLFQFQDVAERAFWMKNTVTALDIIYVAPNGTIISIQKNARPLNTTPLPSYGKASGVLEIRAGLSDKFGLKPGDRVLHSFFHKP